MPARFDEIAFTPSIPQLMRDRGSSRITVLTGKNNSGKSAVLKKVSAESGVLYIGVSRFYGFHYIGVYSNDPSAEFQRREQMQRHLREQVYQNYEGTYFNPQEAIARLTNDERKLLFSKFALMFGSTIEVTAEDPDNDFSQRYVAVDGDSLSVTSSGTRLFLGIMAALMDKRYSVIAIDEPELGLAPSLQQVMASVLFSEAEFTSLFVHKPRILMSTHSHLFLDKTNVTNNFICSRSRNVIDIKPCESVREFHDIQFRLLGNDLSSLFLPDAIVFCEGESDKVFLEAVFERMWPSKRIVVESCSGDIAKRLSLWASFIGESQVSPYRQRTFVVADAVKQAGLERACERAGIAQQAQITWDGNGIESVYPSDIMSALFMKGDIKFKDLRIDNDNVAYGDVSFRKMDLANRIARELRASSSYSAEFKEKLVSALTGVLGESTRVG